MVPSALAMMALAASGGYTAPVDQECVHSLDAVLRADRHRAVLVAFDRIDLKVSPFAVGPVAHSLHRDPGAQALHVFLNSLFRFVALYDQHVDGIPTSLRAGSRVHALLAGLQGGRHLDLCDRHRKERLDLGLRQLLARGLRALACDGDRRRTAGRSWDPTECHDDGNNNDKGSPS